MNIKDEVDYLNKQLVKNKQEREVLLLNLKHVRDLCHHTNKIRWTNNDGDSQFIVEKCPECGLQKDGGL